MRGRALPAALAGLLLAGCQQTIAPPARLADPVTVYISDHGRHAGLVLPSGDARMTEWFWGDWHYFALRERSLGSGLRALFASPEAALGRLDFAAGDAAGVKQRTYAVEVIAIDVERAAAARLQARLAELYARNRNREVVQPGGERFVPDDDRYGLFRNSNHKVCAWLEELGADARCPAIGANFKVRGQP